MQKIRFNNLVEDRATQLKLKKTIEKVIHSDQFILGKNVSKFEEEFAKYLGSKYCIGVGNGLEALQISLISLEIGPGDEVITTPVSAIATTLAILAVGAIPVFVDVNQNGLIDADLILKAISKKTKAIIPVHLYGNSIDLKKIISIWKRYKLYLIEDAAQAHGSIFNNKKLGTFGIMGCFSFYPTKNLGALGDGGAIVTNDKILAEKCRKIRNYGQENRYKYSMYGLNSRLDEIQAAILRIKLKNLDLNNAKRRQLAKYYINKLKGIKDLEIVKQPNFEHSNFHLFVIKVKNRDTLIKYLEKKGIETIIHYPEIIPDHPIFRSKYSLKDFPKAREFVNQVLSLPFYPSMKFKDVDYVVRILLKTGDF